MHRERLPYLVIPIAAFAAITPLLIRGCSCGHDFDFHILNWLEAARQFTHGNIHPHWAYTPAWNAGEPRFVFYPPLSWIIGAILGLIFPWTWTPILYTWLALTAAGLAAYYLTRDFTTATAALLAATVYTVNPYMLFTAYERSAYAELLAAAWIPLLLHAILRSDEKGGVTIPRIAIPVALLWLTNAPAAVMSCYALALLTAIRLLTRTPEPVPNLPIAEAVTSDSTTNPGAPSSARFMRLRWASGESPTAPAHEDIRNAPIRSTESVISTEATDGLVVSHAVEKPASLSPPPKNLTQTSLKLAFNTVAGTALGLGLAAFYIVPAAYERRYVQIKMAIVPFLRIQDNFLFHHTTDIDHDKVLHTASLIALTLIAATTITLIIFRRSQKARVPHPSRSYREPGSPASAFARWGGEGWDEQPSPAALLIPLTILTIAITLLLTPLTSSIWTHAPELSYLQFPWRLLAIIAAILALSLALAITPLKIKPITVTILAIAISAAVTYPAYTVFHQACDPEDTVKSRLALFQSQQGTDPTDEYTPATADNDSLAQANPSFWLSPNPNAKAPAYLPPGSSPIHLDVIASKPEDLILNLRDYPAWHITLNGIPITTRIHRDDGLIALPIPAGPSAINITYIDTIDQTLGEIISVISLALLAVFAFRKPTH